MSVTVCWAAKGGSGTTLIAATLALTCRTDSLLVDLDGQLPMVLGLPQPPGQGATDWLASDAPPAALGRLTIDVDRSTRLLPVGNDPGEHDDDRWLQLVAWLASQGTVVIDAGTRVPPLALVLGDDRAHTVDHTQLLRRCEPGGRQRVPAGRCRPGQRAGPVATPAATSRTPSAHPSWRRSMSIRRSVGSSMPACSRRGSRGPRP